MKDNFFPIYNNSLLVYNEAKNNRNESNLMRFINQSKYELLPILEKQLPEIVFITSYPPRECGIATYTQDLKNAIQEKFGGTFSLKVCALETSETNYNYPEEVKYKLNTEMVNHFSELF